MSTLENMSGDRLKLIMHRVTRALVEKINQKHIAALYGFMFLDATLHRVHNAQLGPMELKQSMQINCNMATQVIGNIQTKAGLNWTDVIVSILKEEGVKEPTADDILNITLMLIEEGAE